MGCVVRYAFTKLVANRHKWIIAITTKLIKSRPRPKRHLIGWRFLLSNHLMADNNFQFFDGLG